MDRQIANYVRGKFWEIVIVWGVSLSRSAYWAAVRGITGVLVGLSVIIPYIGAAVVTFPVILIAWFQWGWGSEFITLTVAYFIIQILDGNVLVPVLFSEAVNLHPVAIIVAILVFGGLWGCGGFLRNSTGNAGAGDNQPGRRLIPWIKSKVELTGAAPDLIPAPLRIYRLSGLLFVFRPNGTYAGHQDMSAVSRGSHRCKTRGCRT